MTKVEKANMQEERKSEVKSTVTRVDLKRETLTVVRIPGLTL